MTAASPALDTLVAEGVTARAAGVDVIGATLRAEVGSTLAIVGAPKDGAGLLLALLAGAVRPRRGKVLAFGRDPSLGAPSVAHVPLAPALPEGVRGRELLAMARALRGGPAPTAPAANDERPWATPDAFGIAPLMDRDTRAMSPEEARALLAFEALTSPAVRAVLVEEPLAKMTSEALAAMPRALRDAKRRAAIVIATASPEDARSLADGFAVLRAGRVLSIASALAPLATASARGVQVRVACADPRPIAAALVGHEDVRELRAEDGVLLVRGSDAARVAAAVQRAIALSDVAIASLRLDALPLEALQAAATAQANVAYQAAMAARGPMPGPMPAPIPGPTTTPRDSKEGPP